MRILIAFLLLLISPSISLAQTPSQTQVLAQSQDIVFAARARTLIDIRYDPKYVSLEYPGGDVSSDTGVYVSALAARPRASGVAAQLQPALRRPRG